MNINDPFGRVQSKNKKEYESLRDSLKEAGVSNPDDAQDLLKKLQRRGMWGLAIIALTTLLLALVLPKLGAFVLICGAIVGIWLIKTTISSQEYIKRYIQEELSDRNV